MLSKFFPYQCEKSVFTIDYEKLYEMGYRGIIFDIDNTLVHHGDDSTAEVDELFRKIHDIGLKTLLLTDNDEKRVLRFIKNIDTEYICMAGKPSTEGYKKALKMLQIDKDQALVVGDQIFTDILGANRSEIRSILVDFIRLENETKFGKRRKAEALILKLRSKKTKERSLYEQGNNTRKKKLFCEMNPFFYKISENKEIIKRHIKNSANRTAFAEKFSDDLLPNILCEYHFGLIKCGKGIDPILQENKVVNIDLACRKMNGLIIAPGEVFSFWKLVGKATKRKGYKDGRVIIQGKLGPGTGGGLCNLAHTIHLLALHSPLDVTEWHTHSDALAPDEKKRIPFSSGTSVSYNYIDLRFKNNTNQKMQLVLNCIDNNLHAQLRSEKDVPWQYEIIEEEQHFCKENEKFYRCSKIYRNVIEKEIGEIIRKDLIRNNRSEVMYDYSLIPEQLITEVKQPVR